MTEKPKFSSSLGGQEKGDESREQTGISLQEGPSGSRPSQVEKADERSIGSQVGGIGGSAQRPGSPDLPAAQRSRQRGCFGSVLVLLAVASYLLVLR